MILAKVFMMCLTLTRLWTKEERIEYLNEAMGSLETFYSSCNPDLHAEYDREVSILLTKPWELNALYEKAGL